MEDLALRGNTILLIFGLLALLVMILILAFRILLRQRAEDIKKRNTRKSEFNLTNRNKYSDVNAFKYTSSFFLFGLALALTSTLLAFSWADFEKPAQFVAYDFGMDEVIELDIPITKDKPKPPPPPPPPKIPEVLDELPEDLESPEFVNTDIDEDDVVELPVVVAKEAPVAPPVPPPPPIEEEEPIVSFAEQMPRFPGCEASNASIKEKENCAKAALLKYIYSQLKYPRLAIDNGIEGMAIIQFVVETDGSISTIKIVRDPGGGCGNAASKVVESMNALPERWTPGRQGARPVKVLYTLPVKFKLK